MLAQSVLDYVGGVQSIDTALDSDIFTIWCWFNHHLYMISILLSTYAAGSINDNPYNTQVRLHHGTYPSNGILEVYLNYRWGTVCHDGFTTTAGTSACRQLGYTNSVKNDIATYTWVLQCLV